MRCNGLRAVFLCETPALDQRAAFSTSMARGTNVPTWVRAIVAALSTWELIQLSGENFVEGAGGHVSLPGFRPSRSSIPRNGLLDTAIEVLGQSYTTEQLGKLIELLKDKELALKDKDKDKELALKDKDKDKELAAARWEWDFAQEQSRRLQLEAQSAAVLCNRHLLEVGLFSMYPGHTLTAAYRQFLPLLVTAGTLTTDSKAILDTLPTGAKERAVANELQDLVHELSKAIHYPDLKETGFVCGGQQPLGPAVAIAVAALQRGGHIPFKVMYVDGDFTHTANLTNGSVSLV